MSSVFRGGKDLPRSPCQATTCHDIARLQPVFSDLCREVIGSILRRVLQPGEHLTGRKSLPSEAGRTTALLVGWSVRLVVEVIELVKTLEAGQYSEQGKDCLAVALNQLTLRGWE